MAAANSIAPDEARIVLIEDDGLFRELLAQAVRERFRPKAFAVFEDGPAGLAHCLAEPPDLVIADLRLPGMDGREVIRRLRARHPATRYLVLTGNITAALPAELIGLGVAGFIDKSTTLEHAVRAIERVLAGGLYFSANVSPEPARFAQGGPESDVDPAVLSVREREIVRLVASGLHSKEIGAQPGLSPRTVEKERVQIMEKLGVRDLPGLIRWSVRHGLV